jgi:hypothetical protein
VGVHETLNTLTPPISRRKPDARTGAVIGNL